MFLLLSEHESFCLLLFEAQVCGGFAVVRDILVLRETSGGVAMFVWGDDFAVWV